MLVVIDFLQRESHRHAHWLLPAAHWLERDDLLALTSGLHDEPYVHYGRRAVDPPDDAREEWRLFLDLTLAMKRPFLGIRGGVNGFVKATRALARVTRRPSLAFGPHWIDRMIIASSRGISWRAVMAHPHGWVFGKREFGHLRKALRTEDKKIRVAPAEFVARTHELLAEPHPVAPAERPFQLANSRRRHSMNSWLNDIDGLHPSGKDNHAVINRTMRPRWASRTGGTGSGCSPTSVRSNSPPCSAISPRPGVVIVDHGWGGSRVFDPRGGAEPMSFGVNRNLLVDGSPPVDPLSQTPALSSAFVGVERVRP